MILGKLREGNGILLLVGKDDRRTDGLRSWKRLGSILLLLAVAAVLSAWALSLRPERPDLDGEDVGLLGPGTGGTVPEVAVTAVDPGKAEGGPIDLRGLSLLCGENIEEYSLTGWVWVNDSGATEEALMEMVQQAVRPLESAQVKNDALVWPTGTWNSGRVEDAWGVNYLRWLGDDRWVESWARSADYPAGEIGMGGMTYLVLRCTGLTGPEMASSLRGAMEDSLSQLGEERGTSVEIICWREGKVDEERMSGLVSQVLAAARAREVERSKLDDLLLVTAFSPAIPERSERGGASVNLQLAVRYRGQDDRTYFHLGTPRIMEDY
ncbi:MAG: hypothetical protein HPY50_08000 [Firmicutes bacterium]|nr:hypothetical protein [Bacillota bacterium]